ncbi:MAG TPA: trypsin-like serine protease [Polyangiaceae bacterium]|nr:trypsin-like serine protease [Polyangiaceae bacterium]
MHRVAPGLLLVCGLTACGADVAEPELGHLSQGIFGGDVDPDHPEVMLLFDQAGALCTGTNILSEGGSGFLLTAAHCVTRELPGGGVAPLPPQQLLVVPGADFALSPLAFPATAVTVEPNYVGGFFEDDVAVVRFATGDEPPPPVLEPLSAAEDALALEDELLMIGFGETETGELNTERRRVARSVAGLDDENVIYSQDDGSGPCFGDSGGPGLARLAGQERVAVVISGGVEGDGEACSSGLGVAMRVSGYEGFIRSALAAPL